MVLEQSMYPQRNPTGADPFTTYPSRPLTAAEQERRRREQEEFWTGIAGIVVAGAVVVGFGKLLSRLVR